ncbi:MAG: pantetheine-phosphate adenylyltransferase [Arcobacteraceae bacterium]|nr:pantetheine-phosphate adenylyltransferase [Arcobacteraceae bacterium]
MKYKRAIYSGTFDPITNGHIDVIKRALKVFDEVVIAIAHSDAKKPMFDIDKRVKLAKLATQNLNGVQVEPFDTLLVDFAKIQNITHIVRGLRAVSDFEFELQMGYANSSLDKNLETIYLMPTLENAFVSSSIVRELIRFDGNFSHLVPENIIKELR